MDGPFGTVGLSALGFATFLLRLATAAWISLRSPVVLFAFFRSSIEGPYELSELS